MSRFWVGIGLSFAGALSGCASVNLKKFGEAAELPTDLSQDMQDKFEVKDTLASAEPSPVPSASPVAPAAPAVKGGKSAKAPAPSARGKSPAMVKVSDEGAPPKIASTAAVASKGAGKKKKKGKKRKGELDDEEYPLIPPFRRPAVDPLGVGETSVYDITWLGVSAGDFTLQVHPHKTVNNRKAYHIKGVANSSSVFSIFYRIHDTVESYFDYDGLYSHRFRLLLDESKQTRDGLELYDSEKREAFYWNRWNHYKRGYIEKKESFPMKPYSQDSLTALYYLRMVPLPDGGQVKFPVVSEGHTWEATVYVVRRETIDSPLGKVKAVVVKPETRFKGILTSQGDNYIWLTDDDRRIVLKLEAKVKIGTVIARLKKYTPGKPQ